MTLNELIERLEDYRTEFGNGDIEVRLMTQQSWPFENGIYGITSGQEINNEDDEFEDGDDLHDGDASEDAVVYIVEGGQLGYGTKRAWDTAY